MNAWDIIPLDLTTPLFRSPAVNRNVTVRPDTISRLPKVLESWVVQKLLRRLEFVMQQLDSAGIETALTEIEIVTLLDLEQIREWNGTLPNPVERSVHDMIQELARAQPTAPAVCAWDGELTYAELDQLSSRVACRLINLDIRPDTLVPLCFVKSIWTIVAMLSVLKSGSAFVHLDASQASDWRERVLAQIDAEVMLASARHATMLATRGRVVVPVDAVSINNLPRGSTATRVSHNQPLSAAYAIFSLEAPNSPTWAAQGCGCGAPGHQYQLLPSWA